MMEAVPCARRIKREMRKIRRDARRPQKPLTGPHVVTFSIYLPADITLMHQLATTSSDAFWRRLERKIVRYAADARSSGKDTALQSTPFI